MDVKVKYGSALVCDIGPHAGMTRVDLTASVYMTDREYAVYRETGALRISVEPVAWPQADGRCPLCGALLSRDESCSRSCAGVGDG